MSDISFLYLVLAGIPAVIVGGALWLQLQALQTARWPSVPGRVVVSTTEMRRVKNVGMDVSDSTPRDFAKIVYEYTIAGQTYRSGRIGLGIDSGDFEVAERMARYPRGQAVTVYYNPNKRSEAILERSIPSFVWKGLALFVVIYAAIVFGSIYGYRGLVDTLATVVPNPAKAPFIAICIGFALFAGLIVYAIQRQAFQTLRWPKAPGRIESATIRSFEKLETRGKTKRWVTYYRPEILYSYEVGGVRYTGSDVGGSTRSSTDEASVKKPDLDYAPGRAVEIHYNKDNPAESILDPSARGLWLLWLFPIGVLALAFVVGR